MELNVHVITFKRSQHDEWEDGLVIGSKVDWSKDDIIIDQNKQIVPQPVWAIASPKYHQGCAFFKLRN